MGTQLHGSPLIQVLFTYFRLKIITGGLIYSELLILSKDSNIYFPKLLYMFYNS